MRVLPAVEEDEAPGARPEDRAVLLHRLDVRRGRVVREYEFAAGSRPVIGTEQEACERIRIDMAFKPHRGPALYVQDDAIAVIECGSDPFRVGLPGQFEKVPAVQPVEPGQALPYLASMHPAPRDTHHLLRLP